MPHVQGLLHPQMRPNPRARRNSAQRRKLVANRQSTSPASPGSASGRIFSSDGRSHGSNEQQTCNMPYTGALNDGAVSGNIGGPTLSTNVAPGPSDLMTDLLQSGLTSSQIGQRYAAYWTSDSGGIDTPQDDSQSSGEMFPVFLDGTSGGTSHHDNETVQVLDAPGSYWVEPQIRLSHAGTHLLPSPQLFQHFQADTSHKWASFEDDITMQDDITLKTEPRHNDTPWSHLNAVIDRTPSSEQAFVIVDPSDQAVRTSLSQPSTLESCYKRESVFGSRTCGLDATGQPHKGCPSGNSIGPPRGDNLAVPPKESGLASDSSSPRANQIQPGGRARRHQSLNPVQREHAALMRAVGNCWSCVFLKYSCDQDEMCQRCRNMRTSSLFYSLSPRCDRRYLPELAEIFLPPVLVDQHTTRYLRTFCKERIKEWTQNRLEVQMTWGYGDPIVCDVTEIKPDGESLLFQNQYKLDLATNQYGLYKVPSPPIGIQVLYVDTWRLKLSSYLDNLILADFNGFPDACFRGSDCEVQRDLLRPLHQYFLDSKASPLPGLCLRLIVITHIMTHSMTLREGTQLHVASQLRNRPTEPYGIHTCPRWLNKELKFVLKTLHDDLLREILRLMHITLHDMSTGSDKKSWARLFTGLLVLSMFTEDIQVAVRCKEDTDKSEDIAHPSCKGATLALEKIDDTLDFVVRLFRQRYHMNGKGKNGFNPIRNLGDREELGDSPSKILAIEVESLVVQYRNFLESRNTLNGPPESSCEPRASRLVAKFLLCF